MAIDVLLNRREFTAAIALGELIGQAIEKHEMLRVRGNHANRTPARFGLFGLCLTIVLGRYLTRHHTPHPAFGHPLPSQRGERAGGGVWNHIYLLIDATGRW